MLFRLTTQYRYNTLNQVIAQQSPDGGRTDFWYDRLGRLAISRNAKQRVMSGANSKYYSYTKYDFLGRITEVGQVKDTSATTMEDVFTRNPVSLDNWHTNLLAHREQVTNTVYDTPYDFFGLAPDNTVAQQKLRNRVSYVKYSDLPGLSEAYDHASFYSYDIHGNVDTLVQDYGIAANRPNMMNKNGNRWKKIVYEYDLISGKVNQVTYQPKFADQRTHRYFYDAENRLTEVQTSVDNYTWDKEAKYEYYLHGPLARTTLGQEQVQGIDYAYTLQGWLKGINSAAADTTNDMGGDAKSGLNKYVGRDALGFALNYFDGEYKPIKAGVTPFPSYRGGNGIAMPDSAYRPLYNGNISSALYNIRKFEENGLRPCFYNYQYDQLNRYVGQDKYSNFTPATNSFGTWGLGAGFSERVAYDPNGNIQRYLRYGLADLDYWAMDSLSYAYYPGTNQLQRVRDNVPKDRFGSQSYDKVYDIDDQDSVFNYKYDSIGNLIEDKAEKITSIQWNVYGKITEIRRNASITDQNTTFWTKYKYDAQGNRIAKEWLLYEKEDRSYINLPPGYQKNYTWYVRDAQGNLLSTYSAFTRDTLPTANMAKLWLLQEDVQIYGSSRLGSYSVKTNVDDGPIDRYVFTNYDAKFLRGWRQYELSNHLGNVLTTISDKKIGVSSGPVGSLIDYYEPDMVNAQDYFPFGMVSRFNAGNSDQQYRFGFNGKENDNEVKGFANQQDYGMRIYDSRLGRFLSVDPKWQEFTDISPYAYAANNPIFFNEEEGEAPAPYIRLMFYGGARKAGDNSAFLFAARNTNISYGGTAQMYYAQSAKFVIDKINAQANNSIASIDVFTHGSPTAWYMVRNKKTKEPGGTNMTISEDDVESNNLYASKTARAIESWNAGSAQGVINSIDAEKFKENAVIEVHGCRGADGTWFGGDNMATNLSEQLFGAGKKNAVVIAHKQRATPQINGEGKTQVADQDYRHGERSVLHNGEVLFTTKVKKDIGRKVIDYYLKKKKEEGDKYDGTKQVYTKGTKIK